MPRIVPKSCIAPFPVILFILPIFKFITNAGFKVLISKLNAVSAELIKIELWNKSIKRQAAQITYLKSNFD
jgi:hypothetical protein